MRDVAGAAHPGLASSRVIMSGSCGTMAASALERLDVYARSWKPSLVASTPHEALRR